VTKQHKPVSCARECRW